MPIRRKGLWRRRTLGLLASLACALLVGEGAVRLFGPAARAGYPDDMFVADEVVGYRLAPDFEGLQSGGTEPIPIRTNADGYRGPPVMPRAAGVRRVVVLGDSFAFGHGVREDEAFPAVMERLLDDSGNPALVVNTGAPGYATLEERALYEQDAERLDADDVVLAFYVGNDFRGNLPERFGRLTSRSGVLVTLSDEQTDPWVSIKAWLGVHSRLVVYLLSRLHGLIMSPEDVVEVLCADMPWGMGFGTSCLAKDWEPDMQRAWERSLSEIVALSEACRSRGQRFVLALLPGPMQYDDPIWVYAMGRCGEDPSDYERDKPNRLLAEWAAAQGIACVDLLPTFVERAAADATWRPFLDVHFDGRGHRVAAELIVDAILR